MTGSLQQWLVEGFAGWLATNDVAQWAPVSGAYTNATEWPCYPGPDMPPTPHRCIVLTAGSPLRVRADITMGLQVRFRGAPDQKQNEVLARAQAVTDMCYPNGFPRVHVALGYLRVGAILPGAELSIGRDGQRRFEHVLNFRLRFRRPQPDVLPAIEYSLLPPFAGMLAEHIADTTPHPAYDDLEPSIAETYEEGLL